MPYVLISYCVDGKTIKSSYLVGEYDHVDDAYYYIDISAMRTANTLYYILFHTNDPNIKSYYQAIASRCSYIRYKITSCNITTIATYGDIFLDHVIFPRLQYYNSYKKLLKELSTPELNTHYCNIVGKKPPLLNSVKRKELLKYKYVELTS